MDGNLNTTTIYSRSWFKLRGKHVCNSSIQRMHRSHDIINYSCETCGKTFKSKEALRQHRSQHSPGGSSTGSNSSSSSSSSYSSSPNYY
ncbi:unnamed protein product [Allacma fusca]|uniref:C2H2-type domain-containing protein n=1 Tax=Allacma fusca TaxID=39272 RepID=A0A8J2Q676_9HEXA|nr:unnamed protein product [Allacma fusca]